MSRHLIAKRMQRISEVREQKARSAVNLAHREVDETQAQIHEIEQESATQESRLLASERAISGAWLQVVASARDATRQQLDEAENRLHMAEQHLSERKTEHLVTARRRFTHDEIAARTRKEWRGELAKAAQKEMDDLANARAARD